MVTTGSQMNGKGDEIDRWTDSQKKDRWTERCMEIWPVKQTDGTETPTDR